MMPATRARCEFPRTPLRNCPKSTGRTCSVAPRVVKGRLSVHFTFRILTKSTLGALFAPLCGQADYEPRQIRKRRPLCAPRRVGEGGRSLPPVRSCEARRHSCADSMRHRWLRPDPQAPIARVGTKRRFGRPRVLVCIRSSWINRIVGRMHPKETRWVIEAEVAPNTL
jgi:hypothetical protein